VELPRLMRRERGRRPRSPPSGRVRRASRQSTGFPRTKHHRLRTAGGVRDSAAAAERGGPHKCKIATCCFSSVLVASRDCSMSALRTMSSRSRESGFGRSFRE
jgi:hypothetical protein